MAPSESDRTRNEELRKAREALERYNKSGQAQRVKLRNKGFRKKETQDQIRILEQLLGSAMDPNISRGENMAMDEDGAAPPPPRQGAEPADIAMDEDSKFAFVNGLPFGVIQGFINITAEHGSWIKQQPKYLIISNGCPKSTAIFNQMTAVHKTVVDGCSKLGKPPSNLAYPLAGQIMNENTVLSNEDVITVWDWLDGLGISGLKKAKPVPSSKPAVTVPQVKIRDDNGKLVKLTPEIAAAARKNLPILLGCVEAGRKVAVHTLRNRRDIYKCISCYHRQRGNNQTRIEGSTLDCGCLEVLGACELWLLKVTAGAEGVPDRCDEGRKVADFSFTEETLRIVMAAIEEVSGHTAKSIFTDRVTRVERTALWALEQLAEIWDEDTEAESIKDCAGQISQFIVNRHEALRASKHRK
ncbi:hypothetical protein ONZ45_g15255 [Pleurotus djamor]|nr:hypothetical protein ONZ45_g15255 [Pleurotus djamor]